MTLPEEFKKYTSELMGNNLFKTLSAGLAQKPPVSIRINPLKCDMKTICIADFKKNVAWCMNTGIYLNKRPAFTFDPLLHCGVFYVQEASSMFIDHVIRQTVKEPVVMLDLCAAPGGKTTACRTALPEGSLLISNEPIHTRANILSENIQKFGHPDIIITNNYPRDFKKSGIEFDVILADVPCSGEGMFRKEKDAIEEWSSQNVDTCRKLQREIINDIWPCLKPGGILIYSTCTFNAKENEENAEWIVSELGAEFIDIETKKEWNITGALKSNIPAYRFIPGISEGEGLFMTVIRKKGHYNDNKKYTNTKQKYKNKTVEMTPLKNNETFNIHEKGDKIIAIPKSWIHTHDAVTKKLNVIHAGVTIGTRKGKDIIPDQSLALSICLDRSKFTCFDINYEQAINYLRKDTISLPSDIPKGIILLTYKGIPIGFGKNIGNRVNNLYPQEWKIKSSHIPENNNIIIERI